MQNSLAVSINALHYNRIKRFVPKIDGSDDTILITDHASLQNPFDAGGAIHWYMYAISAGGANEGRVILKLSLAGTEGWQLRVGAPSGNTLEIQFIQWFTGAEGIWITDDNAITLGRVYDCWLLYDSDAVGNNPTLYINNVALTVGSGITQSGTPTLVRESDVGVNLAIGYWPSFPTLRTFDGYIWDVGIMNGSQPTAQNIEDHFRSHSLADSSFDALYKLDESDLPTDDGANSGSGAAGVAAVGGAVSTNFIAPFGKE